MDKRENDIEKTAGANKPHGQEASPPSASRTAYITSEAGRRKYRRLKRLLSLYKREQRLIAYDIHDGIAQLLAGALLHLQAYVAQGPPAPAELAGPLHSAMELLQDAVAEARGFVNGIALPGVGALGLSGAIDALARAAEKRWGGKVHVVHGVGPAALPAPIESTVFRVVQESLSNACRHSGSGSIRVTLGEHDGWLRVCVRDYWRGFDLEKVPSECFGLRGIRDRVKMLRGRVAIRSAPGRGMRVTVELPASVDVPGRHRRRSRRRHG